MIIASVRGYHVFPLNDLQRQPPSRPRLSNYFLQDSISRSDDFGRRDAAGENAQLATRAGYIMGLQPSLAESQEHLPFTPSTHRCWCMLLTLWERLPYTLDEYRSFFLHAKCFAITKLYPRLIFCITL